MSDGDGEHRTCSKCNIPKPLSAFLRDQKRCRECRRLYNLAYRHAHPERTRELARKYCHENKAQKAATYRRWYYRDIEKSREGNIRRNHNRLDKRTAWMRDYNKRNRFLISLKQVNRSARERGHVGCTATLEEVTQAYTGYCQNPACQRPDTERKLHLDHCHTTGVFRGWLCAQCNQALGLLNDSPAKLRALAAFLERFQPSREEGLHAVA